MVLARAGPNRWWAAAGALTFSVGASTAAFAGAWTLPQGTGQLIATLYGWTDFGPPFGSNPPTNQTRVGADVDVHYGLTDCLTIFGSGRSNIMRSASRRQTPTTASIIRVWD